jgi:zinc transport system substrate-binding protein
VGIKGDGGSHDHAHGDGHSHGDGHDHAHDHGGVDPHLWLDPELCRTLIPALDAAIRAVDPAQQAPADAAAKLGAQIEEFDAWARERLAPVQGRALVTHHSAWERFADRYDLIIAAVIRPIETVEETTEGVRAAIETIRKQGLKAIFVEPQFGKDAVKKIVDETGVRVGELDPLGDGDWFAMMRKNVEAVAAGLAD